MSKNFHSKNIYDQCYIETDGASWNRNFHLETLHTFPPTTEILYLVSIHRSLHEIAQSIII